MSKNHWKDFFHDEAAKYDQEGFTSATLAEVDFIERELMLKPGMRLLDVGCGTGRHSIEFARRGYRVTGVDLSEDMLARAKQKAQLAEVQVEFLCVNAVEFSGEGQFDACYCLCEGALSLFGNAEEPYDRDIRILRNMRQSVKSGAPLLFTILNGCRMIRRFTDADVAAGRFDVMKTLEIGSAEQYIGKPVPTHERGYTP